MRVAPVGAYFADDPDAVVDHARRSAVVTPRTPRRSPGRSPSRSPPPWRGGCMARKPPPDCGDFLDLVLPHVPENLVAEGIRRACDLDPGVSIDRAVAVLGNGTGVSAQDTVPFALWCAGHRLGNYEDALWRTVGGLGDRDTTCASSVGLCRCLPDGCDPRRMARCQGVAPWLVSGGPASAEPAPTPRHPVPWARGIAWPSRGFTAGRAVGSPGNRDEVDGRLSSCRGQPSRPAKLSSSQDRSRDLVCAPPAALLYLSPLPHGQGRSGRPRRVAPARRPRVSASAAGDGRGTRHPGPSPGHPGSWTARRTGSGGFRPDRSAGNRAGTKSPCCARPRGRRSPLSSPVGATQTPWNSASRYQPGCSERVQPYWTPPPWRETWSFTRANGFPDATPRAGRTGTRSGSRLGSICRQNSRTRRRSRPASCSDGSSRPSFGLGRSLNPIGERIHPRSMDIYLPHRDDRRQVGRRSGRLPPRTFKREVRRPHLRLG